MYDSFIDMSYFPQPIQELIVYYYIDKEGKLAFDKINRQISALRGEIIRGGDRQSITEGINYYNALKELIFDQSIIANSLKSDF